jgi:nucleoside-diphosphate-sugar epimerase
MQPYYITDDEPILVRDFFRNFLVAFDKTIVTIPAYVIWPMAYLVHFTAWAFKGKLKGVLGLGSAELSTLRPCAIATAQACYWARVDKAKKELDWTPIYSQQEGIRKTVEYLKA